MFSSQGGELVSTSTICAWLSRAQSEHGIEGLTLLGGEPTEQAAALIPVARHARSLGLNLMIFTGHTLEDLRFSTDPAMGAFLEWVDILVDGPFLQDKPEFQRRWIGSGNQRIHHLSDRVDARDPSWSGPNTLEIRLDGSGHHQKLTINGFPSEGLSALWKRIPLAQFPAEKK